MDHYSTIIGPSMILARRIPFVIGRKITAEISGDRALAPAECLCNEVNVFVFIVILGARNSFVLVQMHIVLTWTSRVHRYHECCTNFFELAKKQYALDLQV